MTGQESPDQGSVTMPRGTTVGYLPQDGMTHAGQTLRQEAMSAFADVLALGREMTLLEEKMSALDPESPEHDGVIARYGECRDEWDRRGGFTIESRSEEVLLGLGFHVGRARAEDRDLQRRVADAHRTREAPPHPAEPAPARRAHEPSRSRGAQLARGLSRRLPSRGRPRLARPLLSRSGRHPHHRDRPRGSSSTTPATTRATSTCARRASRSSAPGPPGSRKRSRR